MGDVTDVTDEMVLMAATADRMGIAAADRAVVRRVSVDGGRVELSALRWGTARPEVVFLHGGGQNAHTWDNVAFRLARPALAIDLPGHGHSGWYAEPHYLPSELAVDLAPALERTRPEVVVGMSMGGLATIAIAGQHPELLRRVILVDVSPGSTPERSADITDFVARATFDSFEDMVAHTRSFRADRRDSSLRRSVLYNARELPDGRWTWRHDRRQPSSGDRMAALFADLPRYWDDVAALRGPTIVVLGGRSPIVTPSDVARYRSLVPDIEIVTIADAGHNVQGDAPEQLARIIDEFVRRA